MKHPVELKRVFNKPDNEMLQQAEVFLSSFEASKATFVARFPNLADPFAEEWAVAIGNARELSPDYQVVNQQTAETQALEDLMDQGRTLFQTLMLYVQMAYPNDKSVLRLFGQPQYVSSRNSQLKLPELLRSAYVQASKAEYQTALTAKGLKEEEIARLDSLAADITGQNIVQQNAMKMRSLAATERIAVLNAIWEKMALVSQCAKLVFQNDATRYSLFLLSDSEPVKTGDTPVAPA